MDGLLKSTAKFAIGTCVTLCAVTVAASVAVGNSLGKVVIAGCKGAKSAIKKELAAQKAGDESDERVAQCVQADTAESSDEVKATAEDFEN